MKNKEQTKKLNLLQACEHFKMWTRQPKIKVANLIEWQSFAPNTGKSLGDFGVELWHLVLTLQQDTTTSRNTSLNF